MKLFELIGVKKYAGKTFYHVLADMLASGNFKELGRGGHAFTLERKTGEVYKFWIRDRGYETFLNLVEKHPHQPHFPKILKRGEMKNFFKYDLPSISPEEQETLKKLKYVQLEKLQHLLSTENEKFDAFLRWFVHASEDATTVEAMKQKFEEELAQYDKSDDSPQVKIQMEHIKFSLKKIQEYWDLIDAMYKIISTQASARGQVYPDMHNHANVMKRKDGTFVITDPYWSDDNKVMNRFSRESRKAMADDEHGQIYAESLDSPADYEVIKHSIDYFAARAKIGGRTVKFIFDRQRRDEWEGMFGEGEGQITFKPTGRGGGLRVLATFLSVMTEFLERYTPAEVYFTFPVEREGLYTRILKKHKFDKYRFSESTTQAGDLKFILTRT